MNHSVSAQLSLPRAALALFAVLLVACSGEEDRADPVPRALWPDQDLVAVAMMTDDRALVVGLGGAIYRTIDAGNSWQLAHVPIVSSLRAIAMADGDRGWVVGDGVILRTDDGGLRWRRQRLPGQSASMGLIAVGAIDANRALAVGIDGNNGIDGIVLRTDDGGASWLDVSRVAGDPEAPAVLGNDVFCTGDSGRRCWLAGRGLHRVEGLGSGAESWKSERFDDHSTIPEILFDLEEVELSRSSAERLQEFVASNRQRGNLEWILEPGLDPREVDTIPRGRDPSAVFDLIEARLQEVRAVIEEADVSPDHIIVLGEPPWDYEDYLDEDAHFLERYWAGRLALGSGLRMTLHDQLVLESLWVGDANLGLAVGRSGAMVRSDDGGQRWQTVARVTPHDLYGVGVGRRRAVAVGAQGGVWTSEDEGRNWNLARVDAETDFFDALRGVSFSPSGGIGFVVGDKGRVLRSRDGGATWAELRSP